MNIYSCQLLLAKIKLKKPYKLSFSTVDKIDSVIVKIILENNSVGIAEAVALPYYSHETTKSIIADLQKVLPGLINLNTDDIEAYIDDRISTSPFAVSAILTAKEFAGNEFSLNRRLNIPMVAALSATENPEIVLLNAIKFHKHGYRTIKLKVGRDIEHDCACILALLNEMPENIRIRIDANQGFNFKQACRFLNTLKHQRNYLIECLEQPFAINAWKEFQEFAKCTKRVVPLMLDESIVVEDDVEKAAEAGADLIKLKLFKHRGITGLLSLVKKAKKLGLKIIFGNGVASEIGNLAEAVVFKNDNHFLGAFEGNGFEKLSEHILFNPPKEVQGNLIWERNSKQRESMEINKDRVRVILEAGKKYE